MKKLSLGTSPGSPVIKTLSFECKGRMFHPWWGNWAPACHVVWQKKKKKETESAVKSARMTVPDGVGFLMEIGSRG